MTVRYGFTDVVALIAKPKNLGRDVDMTVRYDLTDAVALIAKHEILERKLTHLVEIHLKT